VFERGDVEDIRQTRRFYGDERVKLELTQAKWLGESTLTLAQELFDYLISQKIIARNRSNVELCNDSIRITIGLESENKELIQKIKIFYIMQR
jgi:histidinol-phosphate/aromatic aminotransferase/cobyric acid decarboxylase-like protein